MMPQLAYMLGTAAAREGREAGIHWTFAPVVDVNVNPDNPIANTRSLGDDPGRVAHLAAGDRARHARAWAGRLRQTFPR